MTGEGMQMATEAQPETQLPGTFTRRATGLVRDVSPKSAVLINFIPGNPVIGLAYGLFFAFGLYAGGNFLLALLLLLPMSLAYSYSFGLLTAAIPRSGGDYILVSRVLGPVAGVASSFYMMLANGMLSNALTAIFFTTLGLGPGLVTIGLVADSHSLVSAGTTLLSNEKWQFGIGVGVLLAAAIPLAGGWRWASRIQWGLFLFTIAGLLFSAIVALFTSRSSFRGSFNDFSAPITHQADSYGGVLNAAGKAGVDVSAPFSLSHTLPMVAVVAGFGLYSYWSSNIGGELRQGRSTKTAHRMALGGVLSMASLALLALILFHSYGKDFLTAAYSAGLPDQFGGASPTYFVLTSVQLDSVPVAIFLVASFTMFWVLLTYVAFLQPTRLLFAYSLDGLLPKSVSKVTRSGAPAAAVAITVVLSTATLAWALFISTSLFQVVTYTVLAQLLSMGLVGLSALVFPWRRPEMYRASSSVRRLAGVPVVSIAGAAAVTSTVVIWVLYFTEAKLGLQDKPQFFAWIGGTGLLAVAFFYGARAVRRRQGIELDYVYAEIPPE